MFPNDNINEPEDEAKDAKEGENGLGGKSSPGDDANASLLNEGINQGIINFTASSINKTLIKNPKMAKNILGEKLMKQLTGFDPDYLEKNLKFPEFKKEVEKSIQEKIKKLEKKGMISEDGTITEEGYTLAGIQLYIDEIKHLLTKSVLLGEKFSKIKQNEGEKKDNRIFMHGDSFKNIDIRESVKRAIRNGSKKLGINDLMVVERESKGKIEIIYALDISGSMKGRKLGLCKRAGIALGFHAIEQKDKVGLILFADKVKDSLSPSSNFSLYLKKIVKATAFHQTNFPVAIKKAIELFSDRKTRKHLLIISDIEPTAGEFPMKETLEAIQMATAREISISLIGIDMNKESEELAKNIINITRGRLYRIRNIDNIDEVVLEDYYSL